MLNRRAFTLIELLVVIAIIGVLAGLMVAAFPMVSRLGKVNRTKATLNALGTALSLQAAERGGSIAPVPHPLAGDVAPRPSFVRGASMVNVAGTTIAAAGDLVATGGVGLVASDPTKVDSDSALMFPSDVFQSWSGSASPDLPFLYGRSRERIGILGSASGIVAYRRLPLPASKYDTDGNGVLDTPYDAARFPDRAFLVQVPGDLSDEALIENETKKLFDRVLGASVLAELASLGAIGRSEKPDSGDRTALICLNRVRADRGSDGESHAQWKPGTLLDGGAWVPYQLRGSYIRDPWKREILFFLDESGNAHFESAGPDGTMNWNPGPDRVYQTAAADGSPSGDDRDGGLDNIRSGAGKR